MGLTCGKSIPLPAALAVVFALGGFLGCSDTPEHRQGDVLGSPARDADDDREANVVRVSLVEFQIDMPATLPSGLTRFVVTNNGEVRHNFKIEGGDIDRILSDVHLQSGDQAVMQIYLPPGTYAVYCPVFNHRNRGMSLTLTVTNSRAQTATTFTTGC